MNIPFLDLKRHYDEIKDEVEAQVVEVMRSSSYIGGKYVEEFERKMCDYLNVKHVISCANGTDAIMLALRACNVDIGDEVITTPFTFFATAEAIAAIGAVPVFVDVKETDFNIDPSLIESKITPKTKAILPVHLFGFPCDMDEINAIAKKHKLHVVEDAAQAIGCIYKGNKIGKTNNLATFSFHPTKNLGAFGDAGMITTDDDNLAIVARAMREHGAAKNGAKAREVLTGEKDDFAKESDTNALYNPYKYYNYLLAYNSRLDAMQAVVLSTKLKYLDGYNKNRTKTAKRYDSELSKSVIVPPPPKDGTSCYHQYVIRTGQKDELSNFLAEKGIGTGAFYPVPLHLQKAFTYLGYKEGDMPIAEKLSKETVCLPIFPELTDDEVNYVIEAIKEFIKK